MTASESQDGRLSEFTLALLEGTGWYTPDYSMADPLFWGKGQGCDFLNQTCYNKATSQARFSEFCTTRQSTGCTFTGTAKAVCGTQNDYTSANLLPQFDYFGDNSVMLDPFCDNCPYFYGISNLGCTNPSNTIKQISEEVYGDGSMCFMGNLGKKAALSNNVAYCFKQTVRNLLRYIRNINIISVLKYFLDYIQYNYKLETLQLIALLVQLLPFQVYYFSLFYSIFLGYQGTIQCPDSYTFCTTKALQYCKRGCLGRGECVDGVCVCNEGYSGESCLMRVYLVYFYPFLILLKTDLSEPSDNTFLHPLAIYIGLGIIGVVIIVGVIVNRCQKRRERAHEKAGYLSVHGVTGQPMKLGKAYQSPSKSQNKSQGRQGATSNTEMLRQQALEKNAPSKTKGTDALAAIRGVRNKM